MDAENRQMRDREAATSPKWFVAVLFLLSMVAQKCGPSAEQAGAAVLLVAPFVFLAGMAVLAVFRAAWGPLLEGSKFPGRALWVTLGVLVALSVFAGAFGEKGSSEWVGPALMMFGTSYLSLMLVAFRLFVRRSPERAFRDVPIAVMAIQLVFAPALSWLHVSHDMSEFVITAMWMAPGLVGYTTVPIALVLLIEVVVRRVREGSRSISGE